jgi:hypothetical protein
MPVVFLSGFWHELLVVCRAVDEGQNDEAHRPVRLAGVRLPAQSTYHTSEACSRTADWARNCCLEH